MDTPERIWAGRLRGGALCDARCRVMEAKSGCTCAEIADLLTAAIAERDAALAQVERLRGALMAIINNPTSTRAVVHFARAALAEGAKP